MKCHPRFLSDGRCLEYSYPPGVFGVSTPLEFSYEAATFDDCSGGSPEDGLAGVFLGIALATFCSHSDDYLDSLRIEDDLALEPGYIVLYREGDRHCRDCPEVEDRVFEQVLLEQFCESEQGSSFRTIERFSKWCHVLSFGLIGHLILRLEQH